MTKLNFCLLFVGLQAWPACDALASGSRPNIVVIFADDLGYGDVQCLNPERGKIATPRMDQLAAAGMVFTDAHTSSSVCTPSRYSLLTGRYSWRTHLQQGVLWGYSEPLIAADRMTVAGLLRENGYRTAIVGKWHLGMIVPTTNGRLPKGRNPKSVNVAWDGEIEQGPIDRGFDYYYGISASLDMSPYVYIENARFDGHVPRDGKTVTADGFERSDVLPELGRRAVAYIKRQSGKQPFFLYVPLTSPHTPIVPTKEWNGRSGLGKYGDFVMQTDHVVGQIVDAIDAAGFGDETLVLVTSDNGCSKAAGIKQMQQKGHYPSAQFRGSKADLWDGGHRVPFLARWPGHVQPGSTCDETICLTDLMATCAEIVGVTCPDNAGEDSVSFLPALKGAEVESARAGIVHHSISGHFAYRSGKWKLLLAMGSGGWTSPTENQLAKTDAAAAQLYDMQADPTEQDNLYETYPEVVQALLTQLQADIALGRSTPGAPQKNDVRKIEVWKGRRP